MQVLENILQKNVKHSYQVNIYYIIYIIYNYNTMIRMHGNIRIKIYIYIYIYIYICVCVNMLEILLIT